MAHLHKCLCKGTSDLFADCDSCEMASFFSSFSLSFYLLGACCCPAHSTFSFFLSFLISVAVHNGRFYIYHVSIQSWLGGPASPLMEALVSSVSGFHGFSLHVDIQLAGRARMSTGDHVGNFYGPGLEVAYSSSPHSISFSSKNRTKHKTPYNRKTKSFLPCFAYPYYFFPILLFTAKILEQE